MQRASTGYVLIHLFKLQTLMECFRVVGERCNRQDSPLAPDNMSYRRPSVIHHRACGAHRGSRGWSHYRKRVIQAVGASYNPLIDRRQSSINITMQFANVRSPPQVNRPDSRFRALMAAQLAAAAGESIHPA